MTKKKAWYMSDNEIRRSWRCALNQKEQIGILAELNCRSKAEVIEKIVELGLEMPVNRKGKPTKISEKEKKKIWALRLKGESYKKIATILETKPTWQAVRTAFKKIAEERDDARPVLLKALKTYMQSEACTDNEREIIKIQIARGI